MEEVSLLRCRTVHRPSGLVLVSSPLLRQRQQSNTRKGASPCKSLASVGRIDSCSSGLSSILQAGIDDAIRTVIYTGRPLRVIKNEYVVDWNENRQAEIQELTSKGIVPHEEELKKKPEISLATRPWLSGSVAGLIKEVKHAQEIVDEMIDGAIEILTRNGRLVGGAKL